MGMQVDRALRIRTRGVTALIAVFDTARHFGKTSREMEIAKRTALENIGIKKAPQWVVSYLEGYWAHTIEMAYRQDLVFGGMVEGKFYSTHSNRADYYEKHGISASDYADDGRVKLRGHYWNPDAKMAHRSEPRPFFIDQRTVGG